VSELVFEMFVEGMLLFDTDCNFDTPMFVLIFKTGAFVGVLYTTGGGAVGSFVVIPFGNPLFFNCLTVSLLVLTCCCDNLFDCLFISRILVGNVVNDLVVSVDSTLFVGDVDLLELLVVLLLPLLIPFK
jgi:hypothetical protein